MHRGGLVAGAEDRGVDEAAARRLGIFVNQVCDPNNHGEGQTYLGFVDTTTDAAGQATFEASFPNAMPGADIISATATGPDGDTSEFSSCRTACLDISVFGQTLRAPSPDELSWNDAADVRAVRGELAEVGIYGVLEELFLDSATSLDMSGDFPEQDKGFYYLVRLEICGSWQTEPDAEPDRDTMLP